MKFMLHPRFKVGGCDECRKWLYGTKDGEWRRVRPRLKSERTPEKLGCDACPLKGSDRFSFLPRVEKLLWLYGECHSDIGQFAWPEPRLRDNSLFVRQGFYFIDAFRQSIGE